jgi:hypothetical protein
LVFQGYSQSTSLPSGVRPNTRDALKIRICRTPASVTSMGEAYAWRSSSADHARLPVRRSYATTDCPFGPPGRTTTVSPTTSGAAAMPHCRFVAPPSSRMFVRQTTAPVASSRQRSSPVPPSA